MNNLKNGVVDLQAGKGKMKINLEWEVGTLNSGTGVEADSINLLRSIGFTNGSFQMDIIDVSNYVVYIYLYNKTDNNFVKRILLSKTGFKYAFTDEYVYRFLVKFKNNDAITDENLEILKNAVALYSNEFAFNTVENEFTVSDCCNSWWCNPRVHYEESPREKLYVGGVSSTGLVGISVFDLRNKKSEFVRLGYSSKDDHNTPAFIVGHDVPPIAAYTSHSEYPYVRIKVGEKQYDIKSLEDATENKVWFGGLNESMLSNDDSIYPIVTDVKGGCTYASLIRRNDIDTDGDGSTNVNRETNKTIALITRLNLSYKIKMSEESQEETKQYLGLWCSVSRNWGETWEEPFQLTNQLYYGTFKEATRKNIYFVLTTHPTEAKYSYVKEFTINPHSGDILSTDTDNPVLLGNLWVPNPVLGGIKDDGTAIPSLPLDEMNNSNITNIVNRSNDLVYDASLSSFVSDSNFTIRVLDVGFGGSVLVLKLRKNEAGELSPELGGTYGVYMKNSEGVWYFEKICDSGVPVGYNQSAYVGGACFTNSDTSVIVCRENNGVWYTEKRTRIDYNNWVCQNILQQSSNFKLAKPQYAKNASAITTVKYFNYSSTDYTVYYGDLTVSEL